jgi:hypothetical protein
LVIKSSAIDREVGRADKCYEFSKLTGNANKLDRYINYQNISIVILLFIIR